MVNILMIGFRVGVGLLMFESGILVAHAKPQILYSNAISLGVSVIAPPDPLFAATLSTWLDPQTLQSFDSILPYSVLLRNDSTQGIVSVCVRWVLTDHQGKQVVQTMMLHSLIKEKKRMQLPNQFAFMGPQPGLNRNIGIEQNARLLSAFRWNNLQLYLNQSSVRVEVDSIVFEDGRIVGPDVNKTMEKVNSWLKADEDLANQVLGKQGDALRSFLTRLASIPQQSFARPGSGTAEMFYQDRMTTLARAFSNLLEKEGEAKLRTVCLATQAVEKINPPSR